jgi:hypothetical protein
VIIACDFRVVETALLKRLHVLVFIERPGRMSSGPGAPRVLAPFTHYNRYRPHQSRRQRPPDIETQPVRDIADLRSVRRKPVVAGVITNITTPRNPSSDYVTQYPSGTQ